LAKKGIDIISVKEPEFEGSIRVLMLPIMAAIDEYQSYIIGEDTLRGMKTLTRQGYSAGGKPPKGYRTHREVVGLKKNGEPRFRVTWEPDPEWRDKALQAFQMVAEGRSSEDIIKETGVVKDRSGLPTFFRNPTFIGERVFNVHRRKNGRVVTVPLDDPEVIHVPNAHEAIIPRDLFNRVQEIIKKRRPQPGQIRASKHDFILSGLLWCDTHNCTITGSGNKERRYYVCESFRRHSRKESDCPTYKKEPLEKFIINILKEKVFSEERIAAAVKYLIETSQDETKQAKEAVNNVKSRIAKTKREIDGLNQGMMDGGIYPQSMLKLVTAKENEITQLEKQLADFKESSPKANKFSEIKLDEKTVQSIREDTISVLDNESPEALRVFLRNYIEKTKISGQTVNIEFTFRNPDSSQAMVAGVGFEPTTFGL
jgi:site-specific DNA recombinase